MATPIDWIKGTGDFEICELSTQDPVLKYLDVGTKYIKNVVAGTIAILQNKGYFTFEADFYKGVGVSKLQISFISSNKHGYNLAEGYLFQMDQNEVIALWRINGIDINLFYTAASYFANNTWYRIKITRTLNGEFYTYIKGGTFGSNWVLVDPTGGLGINPVTDNTYTISKFLVLDFDVGDRIANIEYREAVMQ